MATTPLQLPVPSPASARWLRSRKFGAEETNNVVELFEVASGGQFPASALVLEVLLVVLTPFSGGTPQISLGDGASGTTWLAATGVTSAGIIRSLGPSSNGKMYTSRDRLTATLSAGLASGQAMVMARVVDSF